jgi:hypothetical protein
MSSPIDPRRGRKFVSPLCQADGGGDGAGGVEEVVDAADEVAFEADVEQATAENRPEQTARTVISRRVDVSASLLSRRRRLPIKVSGSGWLEVFVLAAINQ